MIAEGFELDKPSTLAKIKYHTFKALGFSDVSLNPSAAGGGVQITFGRAVPVVGEASLPVLASIKRVLDCSKLVMARLTTERSPDQIAAATELAGAAFVDVVPLLINAGVDFGSLTYVQLRDILECLSIVVYKHSFDESASSIVPAIKSLAPLLLLDTTSYDNRLLILLVSTSFLKRYDSLGAGIILHQIPIVLQLLVAHPDDALAGQARTFLQMAFLKFSLKGLFLNLFKVRFRWTAFFVGANFASSTHLDPTEEWRSSPPSFSPCRTPPTSSTESTRSHFGRPPSSMSFDKASQYNRKSSTPSWRISRSTEPGYMDRTGLSSCFKVRTRAKCGALAALTISTEFVQFLPRLARHTVEVEKFDPDPMLELVLLVLRNHSQHAHVRRRHPSATSRLTRRSQDLLHQVAGLLRSWLPRCVVKTETLSKVLAASTSKKHEQISTTITSTAVEVLSDGLRGRENVPLPTIAALLDVRISLACVVRC